MAPSAKALKEALIEGTCDVFKLEPDTTSVNKIRHHVEERLGLREDFFSDKDWKGKSKEIIKEYVNSHYMRQGKLLDGWTPEEKKADPKASTTHQSNPEYSEDDAPGSASPHRKRKRTIANPSNDGNGAVEKEPNKKVKSESELPDPVDDEEEEYSDVIDERSTSKRKRTTKEPSQKAPKASKSAKSAAAAEPSDPLDAEVKKLQGQLSKCGVRKLWHHEFKGCDDARAKIRHLKKMLADIGIEGRFSEAKAREIKETRELIADAQAAQEMNRLWGMEAGGRASRRKGSRGGQVPESDASEAENEDGGEEDAQNGHGPAEEEEDVSFAARRRRAHADLAFLGDDSDSD
ncbi:transcriptional regulator, putative [Cordyceps militaris CM01]|uniref:Transcriptional regulator, putative n=1 Tax=Cordyceps militaris (strain CM01) TaxID=983644 RepID=G3J7U9_CORMM|nr:transcriptional regulator, putative [Cordyceps militaris CM01]EGX96363.1 transcriptional regulator, putative [Cordyceps militaris CM01]